MTSKQITDISESLEKLGFEIIKIKEKKKEPGFPRPPSVIKIIITPTESNNEKNNKFIRNFKKQTNKHDNELR